MTQADAQRLEVDDRLVKPRHFVAVATSTQESYGDLPVAAEVTTLADWLTDQDKLGSRAFTPAHPALADNPTKAQLREAFEEPDKPWTERDAAVIFVTGHGDVKNDNHYLVLEQTQPGDLVPRTAIRTSDLISWLHYDGGIEHLLLIIDACYAGKTATDIVRFDKPFPAGWLVLFSAAKNQQATAGALTEAIKQTADKLYGPEGAKWGLNHRYFLVSEFTDAVREYLEEHHPDQELVLVGYRGKLNAEHVGLPNPHLATEPSTVETQPQRHELALPHNDLETHWAPRHSGAVDAKRWLFTGRAALMAELIAATARPRSGEPNTSAALLVTGGAGSGKSAVLARLVTLADPTFITTYADQVRDIPDALRPPVGAVDVAVLATGKYPHEVIEQLNHALGAAPPSQAARADLTSRIKACRAELDRRAQAGQRTVVVLDALDEAQDPEGIANALARLTEDGQGLQLIIGVRSPAGPDDPLAADGPRGPLADRLEKLLSAARIRVDEDPWWHQDDVRDYAASYLRNTPESPYAPPEQHALAGELAQVISDRVGRSFLVARLAATALTQRKELVAPDDEQWLAGVDGTVVGAFRDDLHRIFDDPGERLGAVELLRAVAFAYGRGLPWGDIWPAVANAVADRPHKFGDRDIADLLASPISAYLITDTADDTTVYRLFHDALRATLRESWRDLLTEQPR
ncbi:ATP-binding protein [Pseudonocardia sp. D17]|uniref:ATP-binding protein n=1 Tax=Pseudonocardia sp. D17 TaxID=882661 RepID=UPI002B3B90F6|nr:hypothetical protein PSD17_35250 [Pseudonocardia sp. D17]